MAQERIGIFGGTFDPPHLAHLIAADIAFESLRLKRLFWMPAFIAPHKQNATGSGPADRLAMTREAVKNDKRFEVSDMEIVREGASYSIDTIREMKQLYPDAECYLIIGGDNLATFTSWRSPEQILAEARVVAVPRPGFEFSALDSALRAQVKMLDMPLIDLSSTVIRERVREGRSIRYLVPEPVGAYIAEHKLYL